MSRTPSMAEVFRAALEANRADLHTSMPGEVVRYDAARCLVDVQPLLRASYRDEQGERQAEALPVVPNVPVVFLGAGPFRVTFPMQRGDTVLLIFSEASLDEWLSHGGMTTPSDPRRHALTDAVAIPGLVPFGAARAAHGAALVLESSGEVHLGRQNPGDAMALASKVEAEIKALKAAFDGHTHGYLLPAGTASPATTTGAADAPPVGKVGSTKVRAE